jgi:hypothetical protein
MIENNHDTKLQCITILLNETRSGIPDFGGNTVKRSGVPPFPAMSLALLVIPSGEWEKTPRLQAKTSVYPDVAKIGISTA